MDTTKKNLRFDDTFARDPNFDKSYKNNLYFNTTKNKTVS